MIPLKRKDLTRELALDMDLDHDVVDMVVKAYYSKIQDMMSSCDHVNIKVPELGTFRILDSRLTKKIQRLKDTKENIDPLRSLRNYSIVNQMNKEIHDLERLKHNLDLEKQRKKEIKELRNGNNKNSKSNL